MTTKIQVKVKMEEKEWFENPTTFYTVDHEEIASRAPYIQLNRQSRLYLAPTGQFWDLNNTIAVNYPSPVNSQILQSSIPFTSDPKFLFFVPDLHEKMYIQWHEYLTGLGYRLEPPEHTHLLSITPADIQPYEITHQCKRLFLSDLPLAIESEPGSNLDYKTSKLRIWLQEGFFYITMDANGVPGCCQ
ncbi:hypothetical protein HDV02_003378 [Globomyces sp. JEL0801]|nr:hypothetical protein HDV02_003378 [Globomyces sp. JEL0801]